MYAFIKRMIDFLSSLFIIILLTPFLIPIIIGLVFTGEGYVWYFQERVGLKNKNFMIWKFATMLKDSVNMKGGIITSINDPRITPLGSLLRRTKINELPQLINIVKGDMSFVGPRPVMPKSFEVYPSVVRKSIYNVKPGLTGLGSLFFRNEEELIQKAEAAGIKPWKFYKNEIYPFKGQLETYYQKTRGFKTDFKILVATALGLFFGANDLFYKFFPNAPKKTFSI